MLALHSVSLVLGQELLPVAHGTFDGVEAVIDKDRASALLATGLDADALVLATDVDAVYLDWGSPTARAITRVHPNELMEYRTQFPAGSMGPKVEAACRFAATGGTAVIGALGDIHSMIDRRAGTIVSVETDGIEFHPQTAATAVAESRQS